jgi:phosphatidylcholine synthase
MRAWGVHLLTASGAILGLLAIEAVIRQDWRAALAWMVLAMAVDSLDGSLARWARVKEVIPSFDGALLDNIVDYLNYVFVPALILLRAPLLPGAAGLFAAGAVLLSSGYQFCQTDAKTHDHFFKGFPSFWNVAVMYLLVLDAPPSINLAVVLLLVVGVFVPIKWAYPSRMQRLRGVTVALTALWGISVVAIVWTWPAPPRWLVGASLAYVAYYALVSLALALSDPRGAAADRVAP